MKVCKVRRVTEWYVFVEDNAIHHIAREDAISRVSKRLEDGIRFDREQWSAYGPVPIDDRLDFEEEV